MPFQVSPELHCCPLLPSLTSASMRMPRLRPSLSLLAAATAMRRPMMTANLVQPRDTAAGLFVLEQTDKVKSPPRDKKQYRWLRASNGLRVLLVHDPDTEKAAAALEVHAGHFSDPDERPGLAHFTEHMMFHRGVESEAGHGWPAQARWLIGRRLRAAWGQPEARPDTARSLRQSQLAEGRATLCSCSTRTAVTPPPHATAGQVPWHGELPRGGGVQGVPAEARRLVQRVHGHGDDGLPLRAAGERATARTQALLELLHGKYQVGRK